MKDELDHAEQVSILPPVGDLVEAIKNTTASWKKPRIKSLPETLSEEKGSKCCPQHQLRSSNLVHLVTSVVLVTFYSKIRQLVPPPEELAGRKECE